MEILYNYYDWLKVVHIFSFTAWMAGLFYLPRLLSYHVRTPNAHETFVTMEERLHRIIMVPAAFFTVFTGFILIYLLGAYHDMWFLLKFCCVIGLIVLHYLLNKWRLQLKAKACTKSEKFFRIVNEVPSILLIVIIILVIFKPF